MYEITRFLVGVARQLGIPLRHPVMVAASQTPEYSDVRETGHDGGDFLFVRKK